MAMAFLKEFAEENGKAVKEFKPETLDALLAYDWPGNARELRTAIEHAVVFCRGTAISMRDLPANVREASGDLSIGGGDQPLLDNDHLTVKQAEKQLIIKALKDNNGNRTKAAKTLGISRRTLHRKLHEYHLEGF
jgi:DNA-binding NtrC family response regulator